MVLKSFSNYKGIIYINYQIRKKSVTYIDDKTQN